METRKIKLTLETATRWYNGADAELKALAVQTFPELAKKQLPKTWEELGRMSGGFISSGGTFFSATGVRTTSVNKNVFATKEQAEASIALAQLSQLRAVYRGRWSPDWMDTKIKYCIMFDNGEIERRVAMNISHFLSFQDEETRDLFLENFRWLIEKAQPLMS